MVTCKQAASSLARCGRGRIHPRARKGQFKPPQASGEKKPRVVQTPTQGKRVNASRIVPVPSAEGSVEPRIGMSMDEFGNFMQQAERRDRGRMQDVYDKYALPFPSAKDVMANPQLEYDRMQKKRAAQKLARQMGGSWVSDLGKAYKKKLIERGRARQSQVLARAAKGGKLFKGVGLDFYPTTHIGLPALGKRELLKLVGGLTPKNMVNVK